MNGQNKISIFKQAGSFFTTVHGIITCLIVVVGIAAARITLHDAKIIKNYNDNNTQAAQNKKIDMLYSSDSLRKIQEPLFMKTVMDSLRGVWRNQKILQKNYSNFVEANTGSFSEWKKYMEGLSFEIVGGEDKGIEKSQTRIRIEKVKK